MIVEDQSATRAFLADALGAGAPESVEVVETHISVVFIGPRRVWKLKRAVRLPYVDFGSPERRLMFCEREVERNRATAPELYRGVRRIARAAGGRLALDGDGPLVDAVVEMRRFDQGQLLDRLAARGALERPLMEALAGEVARFHAAAPVVRAPAGSMHVAGVLAVNEAALAETRLFAPERVAVFNACFCEAAMLRRGLLDARGAAGRVRRCHGDLHLRNVFSDNGRPVLFDCIEFNDAIATVDVLYDLAFLLMDLVHRGLGGPANLVMNRYLDATGDDGGLPLVPFFMALRAAVRAHVGATAADEGGGAAAREAAEAYFARARALLEPAPVALVAIGGLSGSGKSTVAEALAPALGAGAGARHLGSDRIRKALHGVGPETRLPEAAYAPEVSRRVYRRLAERAGAVAAGGTPVVADAVFARPEEREAIAAAARGAGVPFAGIWLDLPAEGLRARVAARRGGPSDAGVAVLERQLGYELGAIGWRRLDASLPPAALAEAVRAGLPDPCAMPHGACD